MGDTALVISVLLTTPPTHTYTHAPITVPAPNKQASTHLLTAAPQSPNAPLPSVAATEPLWASHVLPKAEPRSSAWPWAPLLPHVSSGRALARNALSSFLTQMEFY